MSVTPVGRQEASAKTETSPPEECFSCRLWGGLAHLGIAGYLVSCCNAKQTRLGRISILSFAAGVAGLGIYNLSSIFSPTNSNTKT